jgi:endonuclease III-like uncharacterized protein
MRRGVWVKTKVNCLLLLLIRNKNYKSCRKYRINLRQKNKTNMGKSLTESAKELKEALALIRYTNMKHRELEIIEIALKKYANTRCGSCKMNVNNTSKLDIAELAKRLDDALGKETKETITNWLNEKRK